MPISPGLGPQPITTTLELTHYQQVRQLFQTHQTMVRNFEATTQVEMPEGKQLQVRQTCVCDVAAFFQVEVVQRHLFEVQQSVICDIATRQTEVLQGQQLEER
jgi:hypothetical protein